MGAQHSEVYKYTRSSLISPISSGDMRKKRKWLVLFTDASARNMSMPGIRIQLENKGEGPRGAKVHLSPSHPYSLNVWPHVAMTTHSGDGGWKGCLMHPYPTQTQLGSTWCSWELVPRGSRVWEATPGPEHLEAPFLADSPETPTPPLPCSSWQSSKSLTSATALTSAGLLEETGAWAGGSGGTCGPRELEPGAHFKKQGNCLSQASPQAIREASKRRQPLSHPL